MEFLTFVRMDVAAGNGSPLHNVLKIKPPIVFSKRNADEMVESLDEVLVRLLYQNQG